MAYLRKRWDENQQKTYSGKLHLAGCSVVFVTSALFCFTIILLCFTLNLLLSQALCIHVKLLWFQDKDTRTNYPGSLGNDTKHYTEQEQHQHKQDGAIQCLCRLHGVAYWIHFLEKNQFQHYWTYWVGVSCCLHVSCDLFYWDQYTEAG